jgi:hypothetical protein
MPDRFTDTGMLKIPTVVEEVPDLPERAADITVHAAFCSCGASLLDKDHRYNGLPGIRMDFRRPNGETGSFVTCPKINDVCKEVLSGSVVNGEKLDLFCPECGASFPVLAPCDRCDGGDMVVIYRSQEYDINNSYSFCNIAGCPNGMLIESDRVIRAMERDSL